MKFNRNQSELDALLKSQSQEAIRSAVKSLPEESLSLSWRSELNERLREVKRQSVWRLRLIRSWKPALGLALAGCLAMLIAVRPVERPSVSTSANSSIEASLVSSYTDNTNAEDLVGAGLNIHEVSDTTKASDSSSQWTESDLTNL